MLGILDGQLFFLYIVNANDLSESAKLFDIRICQWPIDLFQQTKMVKRMGENIFETKE